MSKLKRHHINEVMDMHNLTKGKLGYSYVYYADDVDKVIEEKDKEIADLIEKNKRLARKDIIMASETIKDLEESHKMEVEQLLMEIVGLKKLVETAAKASAEKDEETRKLKRALWLQRVKTAKTEIRYWRERLFNEPATTRAGIHGQRLIPRNLVRTIREWLSIWDSVEHKCQAKAEEYK